MKNNIDLQGLSFKDIFFFNKLLTPAFITIVYWVSLALIIIGGLATIFGSFSLFRLNFTMGVIGLFTGVIIIIVGFVTTRITFELICVLFNINRNIEKLATGSIDSKQATSNITTNNQQ